MFPLSFASAFNLPSRLPAQLFVVSSLIAASFAATAQEPKPMPLAARNLAKQMLTDVADDVRKNYYDPSLRGLDWDALVNQTKGQIEEAPNLEVANLEIEALLEHLHDSHTFFVPPRNPYTVDYGWTFESIGNRCLINYVEKGSDADRQGIKAGDQLLTLNGFTAERASAYRLRYTINSLAPKTILHIDIRDQTGKIRDLNVAASVTPPSHTPLPEDMIRHDQQVHFGEMVRDLKPAIKDLGPQLMVVKVPTFICLGGDVDHVFKLASRHQAVIIDLRDDEGGLEDSVLRFLDDVLVNEANIASVVNRGKLRSLIIKPNHGAHFDGKLIVLINRRTASAAEIFARATQLQAGHRSSATSV